MPKGRTPLPRAILKLRSSSALRKPNRRRTEPEAPTGCPSCPTWLDAVGKAEWKRITASLRAMGILRKSDRAVLAGLCFNWSLFVKTAKQLNSLDAVDHHARPAASTCADAYRNYLRAAEQFGLTPSARTRIDTDIEGKKLDAFDQFVQRRRGAVGKKSS